MSIIISVLLSFCAHAHNETVLQKQVWHYKDGLTPSPRSIQTHISKLIAFRPSKLAFGSNLKTILDKQNWHGYKCQTDECKH